MSSHWYDPIEKRLVSTVPSANGKGLVKATLTHAKKFGYFPGATTYLDVVHKWGLFNWAKKQVALAGAYNKDDKLREENPEAWAAKTLDIAQDLMDQAPDLGSKIHRAIERYNKALVSGDPFKTVDPEIEPYLLCYRKLMHREEITPLQSEFVVADKEFGIAGLVDLHAHIGREKNAIIDFKTTKFKYGKNNDEPWVDISHGAQLASYAMAFDRSLKRPLINIYMDTTPTKDSTQIKTLIHLWDNNAELYKLFQMCKNLWCSKIGPGQGWWPEQYYLPPKSPSNMIQGSIL